MIPTTTASPPLINATMATRRSRCASVAVFVALAAATTSAQAACANPVNPDATDPAVRALVVGTWYSENRAPQLAMTQRLHQTFLPTGVFDYRDQTCGNAPGSACSQNGGHGVWNARRQTDGSIYIRVQFSDLRRQNECTGWAATFPDRNTMAYPQGGGAKRVQ